MDASDPRHGEEAGNEQHLRDGEDPCNACYQAKILASRRRTKRKTMGHVYQMPLGPLHKKLTELHRAGATYDDLIEWSGVVGSQIWRALNGTPETLVYTRTWRRIDEMQPRQIITPIGVTRRIQGLMWAGYSTERIAAETGCHVDSIRDARDKPRQFLARRVKTALADVYDRLSMTAPVGSTQQERAGITRSRNLARRNGWVSPLAWRDIDDPDEVHDLVKDCDNIDGFVDEIVVLKVIDHKRVPDRVNLAERREIVRRWREADRSLNELVRLTGWKVDRYYSPDAA